MQTTFLSAVDKNKFQALIDATDTNVQYFEEVCSAVVQNYAQSLDDIMKWITTSIINSSIPVESDKIEKALMELCSCIYFTYENLEHVGIYDTLSKAAYKEVYNNIYTNNIDKDSEKRNKKTVAELTSIAEMQSQYESTLNDIYSSAYKRIKNKIDAAQLMVASLSKILSRRMQEDQISKTTNKRLVEFVKE